MRKVRQIRLILFDNDLYRFNFDYMIERMEVENVQYIT